MQMYAPAPSMNYPLLPLRQAGGLAHPGQDPDDLLPEDDVLHLAGPHHPLPPPLLHLLLPARPHPGPGPGDVQPRGGQPPVLLPPGDQVRTIKYFYGHF